MSKTVERDAFMMRGPAELRELLRTAPDIRIPRTRVELFALAHGATASLDSASERFEVAYDVPDRGRIVEAEVLRCRNGLAVNYPEPYMRRRDPDCLVVGDDLPTDKPRYAERYHEPFGPVRQEILRWLATQPLIVLPFRAGQDNAGYDAVLVVPRNAAFFAAGLADLQGMLPDGQVPPDFEPRAVIYVAPPFRHTHAAGRQLVVHCRTPEVYEIFALNLYPGPSAKKGVYGVLLELDRQSGAVTVHGSTVQVVTPYDNIVTILHEGASGSGKSEMLEYVHREPDGRLLLGENLVTGEVRHLSLPRGCDLRPVTDDMAACPPDLQGAGGKLVVADAESAWFLRVNHIDRYGTDAQLERLTVNPSEPLLFLNLHAVPGATCLIWEHVQDGPQRPCPNPRVIVPRRLVPNVVNLPVEVDVRSLGLRTPPCTAQAPTYGIAGVLHVLPAALAWLWRLVAPRGHANPSITDSEGLAGEGVGSFWPFAAGRRVDHANLLLHQIRATPRTRYTLSPNQHIGCWKVGFMPQWLAREYLARRGGARFRPEQLVPARCPLLGWALSGMMIEGTPLSTWLLQVDQQPEVGAAGYDAGARQLTEFFTRELRPYLAEPELDETGRRIMDAFLNGADLAQYEQLLPGG